MVASRDLRGKPVRSASADDIVLQPFLRAREAPGLHVPPAVDEEARACDEVGAREEENGLRDILGRADATEKRLARAPLLLAGLDSDRARCDPADADLGRERPRKDPGQHRL